MARTAAAYCFIIGGRFGSTRIARLDARHTFDTFEDAFDAPEAATCKHRSLNAFGLDNLRRRCRDADAFGGFGAANDRVSARPASRGEGERRRYRQQRKGKFTQLA